MSSARPPSITLSLRALLSFPIRICNPPPAASRVRSCKVTPLIKVTLDDVLNKRHLPPLTLKDFEEYLVYVEHCPQYLYFLLWLKEYDSRYAAWLASSGCAPATDLAHFIPPSPPLALFFTRAKQTFLDPAAPSPYTLPLSALHASPSTHSLSPSIPAFTTPEERGDPTLLPPALARQPHPHPRELAPLANYARGILKGCVARFAEGACHNVGARRAWCGIAAGTLFILLLGLIPGLVALLYAQHRWWRIVAWPGAWLGGTVLISSLHGICMMIYIFGDLRQLHAFELARPPISPPRALARARSRWGGGSVSQPQPKHDPPPPRLKPPARPLSPSVSASATSTGTPVVHLRFGLDAAGKDGRDAVGTTTTGSNGTTSTSGAGDSTTTTTTHTTTSTSTTQRPDTTTATTTSRTTPTPSSSTAGRGAQSPDDDDFGISVSPAYYYPAHAASPLDASSATVTRRESAAGAVMRWVLGRRGGASWEEKGGRSLGEKSLGERSAGEKSAGEKMESEHVRSAGTFGVRGWAGRGSGRGVESASGGYSAYSHTATAELEKGGVHEDEDDEEVDAEFAFRVPGWEGMGKEEIGEAGGSVDISMGGCDNEGQVTPTATGRGPTFGGVASPPLVTPPIRAYPPPRPSVSTPILPLPTSPAPTPPTPASALSLPAPTRPRAALRVETALPSRTRARAPNAAFPLLTPPRRVTPYPAHAHAHAHTPPSPPLAREWWDTCPRHPAVDALSPSHAPITHTHIPLPLPPSNSARTSLASSDVHSRVRPAAYAYAPHAPLSPSSPFSPASPYSPFTPSPKLPHPHPLSPFSPHAPALPAVPAFGPLTRVLSPVAVRGQWEIVVRSACAALLGATLLVGALAAVPTRIA